MRLGGPVFAPYQDPDQWVQAVKALNYTAAYCPVDGTDPDAVKAYAQAAADADIVIAEVGAWSNPMSTDDAERKKALHYCRERLALADEIGAQCCVNIAGSRSTSWVGPTPADLTQETFDMIVETVRSIIDEVKPTRTYYTLETMPWMYPDSVESYVALMRAIDRKRFAVHFDPINLICSPQRYFGHRQLIRDFIDQLGPHIKSCHLKDIKLGADFMVHLDEVPPGEGGVDYVALLKEIDRLHVDLPVMLEHLPDAESYDRAAAFVRSKADEARVRLHRG